ncbi:hypothetical protein FDE77_10705 [Clostridium botulinum]|nr:hypothetical protein [Clostridium botulinum]
MKTKLLVRKLCRDILCLAMLTSEDKETDIYVKYFPHVNEFDVEIFPNGFNNCYKSHTDYQVDLTGKNALSKLIEIKENIEFIKRKGE